MARQIVQSRSNEIRPPAKLLAVGATGSIGRLVVAQALKQGYRVRALVRDLGRARRLLPAQAELVECDVTRLDGLMDAARDVDAVVFTLGAGSVGGESAKDVDYAGVRNVLSALAPQKPRIAMMTAIGVTKRTDSRLGALEGHDWKRRAERLIRVSGAAYTIVRPGWFDYNDNHQHRLVLLQGDTRWASDPSDGVVARLQIAQVLVNSLCTRAAAYKTVELVAEQGAAIADFEGLFSSTAADVCGSLDAVKDRNNMPLTEEPAWVRAELAAFILSNAPPTES